MIDLDLSHGPVSHAPASQGPASQGPASQGPVTRDAATLVVRGSRPRATVRPARPMNITELLLAFGTCACLLLSALMSFGA